MGQNGLNMVAKTQSPEGKKKKKITYRESPLYMAALMKARTLKDYRLWKIQMFYVQGLWYIQAKKTRTKALGLNA